MTGQTTAIREGCHHGKYRSTVSVSKMKDVEGLIYADIRIWCAQCGCPFRFIGCEVGLSPDKPMISFDGKELRTPVTLIQ